MKKFAFALISASTLIFGFGMVANAQYTPGPQTVTASPTTVAPGGIVTVTISGCTPGETLTVTLVSSVATATCVGAAPSLTGSVLGLVLPSQATNNGTGTAQVTAPTAGGTYTGSVTGTAGFTGSFTITVTASTTPPGGLPATGSGGISTTTGIAIGLFAVGLGLLGVTQVRRRHTAVA